jgi:biotin carboxylase
LASETPIDAIVPVDDAGVVIASRAAERLGLPHNPSDAARATRDKDALRRALARAEVPQPGYRVLTTNDDPQALAAEIGYPLVVKPLRLSGSRGVIKVGSPTDLIATVNRVRNINRSAGEAPDQSLLLERFQPGPEIAIEGMLWQGTLEVLAIFDKPDPLDGPYFEETIYVTPSRHPADWLAEATRVTQSATVALGLREGPIHAELRLTDGRPHVIEVAARSIGGVCGRALSFGLLDTPLEVLILRHALGRRQPALRREFAASGVMMLPIPRAGTFRGMSGIDAASEVTGVTAVDITTPIGSHIDQVPEADRYLGFVFARGDRSEAVEAALREAHRRLEPIID